MGSTKDKCDTCEYGEFDMDESPCCSCDLFDRYQKTDKTREVLLRERICCLEDLLEAAQTQSRCDLIDGEPGHQKLLCDRLQADLEKARSMLGEVAGLHLECAKLYAKINGQEKELAIQAAMIEAMVILIDEFETIKCPRPKDYVCPLRSTPREKNCVECLKKYFREQAEKEQANKEVGE